jgi:pectin methylesterase-like acyl-CoA thioesterase
MYKCIIGGQTDFFYGFGTLWVTNSQVKLRGCGGGITAWKGTNTTFVNKYGVYIHDSHIAKANSSLHIKHECALGRPWNADMRSIFANNYLDDSIMPSGYIEWDPPADPRIGLSK